MVVPPNSTFVSLTQKAGAQYIGVTCAQCLNAFTIGATPSNIVVVPAACPHRYHLECNARIPGYPCNCHTVQRNRALKIVLGATVGVVLAPVVATAAVGVVGFGSVGVGASTLAAAWQASIGNVAAGSLFAVCQSIGAGGALPAIGYIAGAGIGAAAVDR